MADKSWVHYCLEDAMRTLHSNVQRPGVKKYKTFWPTKPGEVIEDKPEEWIGGDYGHMEIVIFKWLPHLNEEDKGLIYLRHGGRKPVSYREIGKKLHLSREGARLKYYSVISYLEYWVPRQSFYDAARIARICSRF